MTHKNLIEELYLGCEIVIHRLGGKDCRHNGIVERVDDLGDLHGTWGFLAVIPGVDQFSIVSRPKRD